MDLSILIFVDKFTQRRTFLPICSPICCLATSQSGALHVEYSIRSLIEQLYPGIEYINTAPATTAHKM